MARSPALYIPWGLPHENAVAALRLIAAKRRGDHPSHHLRFCRLVAAIVGRPRDWRFRSLIRLSGRLGGTDSCCKL